MASFWFHHAVRPFFFCVQTIDEIAGGGVTRTGGKRDTIPSRPRAPLPSLTPSLLLIHTRKATGTTSIHTHDTTSVQREQPPPMAASPVVARVLAAAGRSPHQSYITPPHYTLSRPQNDPSLVVTNVDCGEFPPLDRDVVVGFHRPDTLRQQLVACAYMCSHA